MFGGLAFPATLAGFAAAVAVMFGFGIIIPARLLVFICFFFATVVSGILVYYTGIVSFSWLPYLAVGLAFARYLIWSSVTPRPERSVVGRRLPASAIICLAFSVYFAFISVVDGNITSMIVGFKNYILIWLISLVVFSFHDNRYSMRQLEFWLLGLSVLQLPFVIAQRLSTSNWDAYVGTFGGDPEGGGSSGILMIYAIVAILISIGMWQEKRLCGPAAGALILVNLAVIGLGEVKAFFFLMPFALIVQQWPRFRRGPLQSILLVTVSLVVVYILIGVVENIYSTRGAHRERDAYEAMQDSFGYFFSLTEINYLNGEVGRGASLAIWWTDFQTDLVRRLVGYGMGASRSASSVAVGIVSQRFAPLQINATTLAQLLWDGGVIGASLFVAAILSAISRALHISRSAQDIFESSFFRTAAAILSICVPLLIYDRSLLNHAALQILMALLLGVLWRESKGRGFRGETLKVVQASRAPVST